MDSVDTPNISDKDSTCNSYRDDTYSYKKIVRNDDPNHEAMLHLLEVLMNSGGVPVLLSQLSQSVFSPGVDAYLQEICKGDTINNNDTNGLRKFLANYPSLFRMEGDYVSAAALDEDYNQTFFFKKDRNSTNGPTDVVCKSSNSGVTSVVSGTTAPLSVSTNGVRLRRNVNLSVETEAVKYFQNRLASRSERWMPIRSLAGHLSQASEVIRTAVGPQSQFRQFLLRHPLVFEIQGDLVGLRDQFSVLCLAGNTTNTINGKERPHSLIISSPRQRRKSRGLSGMFNGVSGVSANQLDRSWRERPVSMVLDHNRDSMSTKSSGSNDCRPTSIDSSEFQAALFLRSVLLKKPNHQLDLNQLFLHLAHAPAPIRDSVGWTRVELEQFILKVPTLLQLDQTESIVRATDSSVAAADPLTIVVSDYNSNSESVSAAYTGTNGEVTNSTASDSNELPGSTLSSVAPRGTRTIVNHSGTVYHVTRPWGIIDLGHHEHVFFDKSIFRHLDDLRKHFTIGEKVYFNAILAPRQSRAKWRATQVWKETDNDVVKHLCGELVAPLISTTKRYLSYPNFSYFNENSHFDDEDIISSCSPSILMEQRNILENCKNIDQELAEIIQLSKVEDYSDIEDYTQDSHQLTGNCNGECDDMSSVASSSQGCLSSSSGLPSEPGVKKHATSRVGSGGGGGNSAGCNKKSDSKTKNKTVTGNNVGVVNNNESKMVSMSTQTVSTGEIMSVNVFHG